MIEIYWNDKFGNYTVKLIPAILILCLFSRPVMAQEDSYPLTLETVINEFMGAYPFSLDNRFKLSVYSELKGRYSDSLNMISMQFGNMGTMFFFQNNCLLKTNENRAYSLDRFDENGNKAFAMNQNMEDMFEGVMLLGNYGAEAEFMEFVDEGLMRKNIQPFHKVYLRHILLKYGKYDPRKRQVVFQSDWIPQEGNDYEDPRKGKLVRRHTSNLKMILDDHTLRGFYEEIGGEVYVHNVDRNVVYASAEDFNYNNITAFKLFAQKLFIESIQYVVQSESIRIKEMSQVSQVLMSSAEYEAPELDMSSKLPPPAKPYEAKPATSHKVVYLNTDETLAPLYHEYSWIPMMLTLLRHNQVNIGEPDVIRYFVDQPYFSRVYDQLNGDERDKVDQYLSYR